jgi:hypothetical protein
MLCTFITSIHFVQLPTYGYGAPVDSYGSPVAPPVVEAPAEPNILCQDVYQIQCNTTHQVISED